MKKRNVLLWLCALCFPLWGMAQGFIHPGALNTHADFERVKEKLAIGAEPWTAAYKKFKTSRHLNLDWKPNPTAKIIRGGWNVWEPEGDNYGAAMNDAHTAYQCAMEWRISGDERYAKKSIEILNAWARTCKKVTGNSNGSLASGIYGYEFANAGELMRGYEGWKPADFKRYQEWVRRVFTRTSFGFLEFRHGCYDDHYWSNWGLCNVLCIISAGILCDDVWLYNEGMEYYKYMEDRRYGESLHHLVHTLFEDERGPFGYLGQMQESNRDQGHASMAVALAADICGVGRNQGEDAYAHMNDRIAAGFEYVAAYNCGVDGLPNVPYTNSDGTFSEMGWGARGTNRCTWPRIVNYYENVRGVKMPYSRQLMETHDGDGIDAGGGFYGGNSGGYDHLGFTSLMCSLDPLTDKTKVPTILGGMVQYGGKTSTRTELSNIPKGSQMKITVVLPEGEEDTGKWSWDDDASCTSNERELTLETSRVFPVRYVNSQGVECTRMYSFHVEGEGTPEGVFTVYAKTDGVESSDTLIYVKKYSNLTFGISYDGFKVREWKWERSTDGKKWSTLKNTTPTIDLTNVATGYYYRVTMIHRSGAQKAQIFRVEVSEIDPYVIYNGNKVVPGTSMVLEKGSSFSLYAEPTSILGKLETTTRIYKWVVGTDTIQSDTLTYHIDGSGKKVADLNDTLHVKAMDSCFSCKLIYRRISETGAEAQTVYNFEIPVYEAMTEAPSSDDSYYICNASTGAYLRNTDARFLSYEEEQDKDYLWKIRRLPSSYGNRYLLESRTNSIMHLDEKGSMSSLKEYSKHSFNLLHKCTDENLYAIQRSSAATGGLLVLNEDGTSLVVSMDPCSAFPYRIIKKVVDDGTDVEEVVLDGRNNDILLTSCRREGRSLTMDALEDGFLRVYAFDGRLVKSCRCEAGQNTVALPGESAGWVIQYVGESGRVQGLKLR